MIVDVLVWLLQFLLACWAIVAEVIMAALSAGV